MPAEIDYIRTYFDRLGFEPKIADIYVALLKHGPQTISELARTSGVERTRIHRIVDVLSVSHLVELEVRYKRYILKAAPIASLEVLLSNREQELQGLKQGFTKLQKILDRQSLGTPATNVQFYRGVEGYKQMFWHQTRAQGETLCILHESMQSRTQEAFFERWVRECNARNLHFRGIIDSHFSQTLKEWYAGHSSERLESWESRYVPVEIFKISHCTVIYDTTVAHYDWNEGEAFGIEMNNRQIAESQRTFFEMLWAQLAPAGTS